MKNVIIIILNKSAFIFDVFGLETENKRGLLLISGILSW